jgi:hypothetical protein
MSILAYELLAVGYAALRRQPAIAAGRAEALRELPALLAQRRQIQARRTASVTELASWIAPAPPPWAALRVQRRLAALTG